MPPLSKKHATNIGSPGQKEAVRAHWDHQACGERYGAEQDRIRYELEPEILRFAGFPQAVGLRVLEIGVGMGADLVRWCRAGAIATGIDLTARAAGLASDRLVDEGVVARVAVADAERLPFADEAFDLVYSWGVLHHTPDVTAAVHEAQRVLAPGGRLKLMLYHRHSCVAVAAWVRFCLLRGRPYRGLRHAVAQVESPGTQAFTHLEAERLLAPHEVLSIRSHATVWDRRWLPGAAHLLGDRAGWFLLCDARKPS